MKIGFKPKLVYHVGINAGFFSEYNNMLLAYIYCLDNNIKFNLYSKDANFGFKDGWKDFFVPFVEESTLAYHSKLNFRSNVEFTYFKSKKLLRETKLWKLLSNTKYLTYEVFDSIKSTGFLDKEFNIPEFSGKNSLKELFAISIHKSWNYNERTKKIITDKISDLKLPASFVSIHIRGGDKRNEHKLFSVSEYIIKLKTVSDNLNLFIATDDFQNISSIMNSYPEYNCYYLCTEDKNGYDQKVFEKQQKQSIKNELYELFATVDILSQGECFIGTYSSNIGSFVSARRNFNNCFALDFEEWRVW